ncbi:MAG: glycosyltransferase family 2 protein [Acidobacteriaceae bacterium]
MEHEPPGKENSATLLLSVLIPARNEAEPVRDCLASLVQQSEDGFLLGQQWELTVVDDASTDATKMNAAEFPGVAVLDAPPLAAGWTGKSNALWFAAQQARGKWLLFTDADTIHEAGSLRRALHEAEKYHVALLSYSPRQLVHGLVQRALMPLIFADLAHKYPPRLVNSPDSSMAAANGQFLMMDGAAYRRLGGHAAVRASMVEDVELARRCKQAKAGLRFRYAPDAVSTKMYRSFSALYEGWIKNLAALFPDALVRGFGKLFQAILLFGLPLLGLWLYLTVARPEVIWAVGLWWVWRMRVHYARVVKAHFALADTMLSPLALPLYAWLLLASWTQKNLRRQVAWKGRRYSTEGS